jgi:hypothetical protein
MFKEYVCLKLKRILFIYYFSSDSNHFNENWLEKIRIDSGDNYRIKVLQNKIFKFI